MKNAARAGEGPSFPAGELWSRDEDGFAFPKVGELEPGRVCSTCLTYFGPLSQNDFGSHVGARGCVINLSGAISIRDDPAIQVFRVANHDTAAWQVLARMAEMSRSEQEIDGVLLTAPPHPDVTTYVLWDGQVRRILGYCAFRVYKTDEAVLRRVVQDLWVQPRGRGTQWPGILVHAALLAEGTGGERPAVNAPMTRGASKIFSRIGHPRVDLAYPRGDDVTWRLDVEHAHAGFRDVGHPRPPTCAPAEAAGAAGDGAVAAPPPPGATALASSRLRRQVLDASFYAATLLFGILGTAGVAVVVESRGAIVLWGSLLCWLLLLGFTVRAIARRMGVATSFDGGDADTGVIVVVRVPTNVAGTQTSQLGLTFPRAPTNDEVRDEIEGHLRIPLLTTDEERAAFLTGRVLEAALAGNEPPRPSPLMAELLRTYLGPAFVDATGRKLLTTLRDGERHQPVAVETETGGLTVATVTSTRLGSRPDAAGELAEELIELIARLRPGCRGNGTNGPHALLVVDVYCVDATISEPLLLDVRCAFLPLVPGRLPAAHRSMLADIGLFTGVEAARLARLPPW